MAWSNVMRHETVMFFNQPDSPLRVDFLNVDQETMQELMANAVKNGLDVENERLPLSHAFGTEALYSELRTCIDELYNA